MKLLFKIFFIVGLALCALPALSYSYGGNVSARNTDDGGAADDKRETPAAEDFEPEEPSLLAGKMLGRIGDEGKILLAAAGMGVEEFPLLAARVLEGRSVYAKVLLARHLNELSGGGPFTENTLETLLADDAYAVREQALLSMRADRKYIPHIRRALGDSDSYVRAAAAESLAFLNDETSAAALERAMENEKGWVKLRFAYAASVLGSAGGREYLRKTSSGEDLKLRSYALTMRFRQGEPAAQQALIGLLQCSDDRAADIAAEALAQSCDSAPVLARTLAKGSVPAAVLVLEGLKNKPGGAAVFEQACRMHFGARGKMMNEIARGRLNAEEILALGNAELEILPHLAEIYCELHTSDALAAASQLAENAENDARILLFSIGTLERAGGKEELALLKKLQLQAPPDTAVAAAIAYSRLYRRLYQI